MTAPEPLSGLVAWIFSLHLRDLLAWMHSFKIRELPMSTELPQQCSLKDFSECVTASTSAKLLANVRKPPDKFAGKGKSKL